MHEGDVLDGVVEHLQVVRRADLIPGEVVHLAKVVCEDGDLGGGAGQPRGLDEVHGHAQPERVEHQVEDNARGDLAASAKGEGDTVLEARDQELLLVVRVEGHRHHVKPNRRLAH